MVAALYEVANDKGDLRSTQTFVPPLKKCVQQYPFLSVVVNDKHTDKPAYHAVSPVNLEDHISIIDQDSVPQEAETTLFERVLPPILDRPWPANRPPWRIVVVPLSASDKPATSRCLIVFAFSHALGDGMTGPAFHHTFLDTWRETTVPDEQQSSLVNISNHILPSPFDTRERLPISWGFLLRPLIAVSLPKFLVNLLGLRAAASTVDEGTWLGSRIFFDLQSTTNSRVKLIEVEAPLVQKVLQSSREQDAKLTGTFHQLIVRALSKVVPDKEATNFVSGTAIDMRGAIGIPGNSWGLYVSGHYEIHERATSPEHPALPDEMWKSASLVTKRLAVCAATLQDQAIGLLRYVPSIMSWTKGKVGQKRDSSYELSNLLAFDDTNAGTCQAISISKMIFSQPGNAPSAPLAFNVISVKGGNLICAVSWQPGALGVPLEEESPMVETICQSIKRDFASF